MKACFYINGLFWWYKGDGLWILYIIWSQKGKGENFRKMKDHLWQVIHKTPWTSLIWNIFEFYILHIESYTRR